MKKIVLIIIFISITLVLTLTNVGLRKDSTNIDIKIQNIEAFGNNEDDDDNPCKSPGGVCMTYDKDGNPVFTQVYHSNNIHEKSSIYNYSFISRIRLF